MKIEKDQWIDRGDYRKLILASPEDLGKKGNLVQVVEIKPGHTVKRHHHKEQTEFFYILEGEADLTLGDETHSAKPGDAFLCRPGTEHKVENRGTKPFRLLVAKSNWEERDSYWE
jgi:quercetin dioxygenase-like cupin family protein